MTESRRKEEGEREAQVTALSDSGIALIHHLAGEIVASHSLTKPFTTML